MIPGLTASRVELFTPLTCVECAQRLSAKIDKSAFGAKPVLGYASERTLRLRKRISYRNSFQTTLRASLQPEGAGTRISGTAGVHPLVQVFMLFWLGIVTLAGGGFAVFTLIAILGGRGALPPNAWLGVVIPPAMIVFGLRLVRLGRYLARDEARFLTDFLIATLGARALEAGRG